MSVQQVVELIGMVGFTLTIFHLPELIQFFGQ